MDDIIKLLQNVCGTMETISVVGVENQDRFVGCAHAVRAAVDALETIQAAEKVDMRSVDTTQPDVATGRG